jgi:hypothetical protein
MPERPESATARSSAAGEQNDVRRLEERDVIARKAGAHNPAVSNANEIHRGLEDVEERRIIAVRRADVRRVGRSRSTASRMRWRMGRACPSRAAAGCPRRKE